MLLLPKVFLLFQAAMNGHAALAFNSVLPGTLREPNQSLTTSAIPFTSSVQLVDREVMERSNLLISRASVACPENVGAQPVPCSSCGGEDPSNRKHCKDKNPGGGSCQCLTSEPTGTPLLTTITASQSSKIVTGTYVLQTITSYSKLRESITTTVTSTTTATDGSTGVQTAAAVILAGGVAWFLGSFFGDAAVAETALETPTKAENHKDDDSCPDPELSCSECLGVGGMCIIGAATGCGCEENICPSEDKRPKCLDPHCKGGNDHKCTEENQGCECSPDPEEDWPGVEETLFCSECGGLGLEANTYKGNDKWKDCLCVDDSVEEPSPYQPLSEDQYAMLATALSGLPQITETSYSLDPSDNMPACQRAGWGAPEEASDRGSGLTDAIKNWCESMDNKEIFTKSKGIDTQFKMFPQSYYSYWLSANFWYQASSSNNCGDSSKVSVDECTTSLTSAMKSCDPSGDSHGASLAGKCIQFNITLDGDNNPYSPPWNRLPESAYSQCDTKAPGGVLLNWFSNLYPQFCDEVNNDKTKALSKDLTNKDFKAPSSKRYLSIRTPPPSGSSYDGYSFHFDWSGGEGNCRKDCSVAFSSITSSKCGHTGGESNQMSLKATLDVGCGTYSYEIKTKPVDEPPPPESHCVPTNSDFYMSFDSISKNINDFCDKLETLGPVEGRTNHKETYNTGTPDVADFSASWDGDERTTFSAIDPDSCKTSLQGFINGCNAPNSKLNQYGAPDRDSNPLNWKHGGTYKADGITYTIAPTGARHTPAPLDYYLTTSCAVFYKGGWNTFDIWGYGRLSNYPGPDQLLTNIKKCGLTTQWHFEYYDKPQNAVWPQLFNAEWHANGRIPIGPQQWDCVTEAIRATAPAAPVNGCSGQ